ncbi:peptidase M16 [Shewanella sp. NFH-SH190041]|uniref:M16 family metallopeptidase n=1 Tax=Shewanella sp. NFH-SH190041 TaxID=2950245 RepID=UPI0021C3B766|nr:pitrilysin family protein [Shewanella sp. NFH-SH190041]BDM65385.1 peptidase M16 [Shewanella sp. NFH-SH190041]
MKKWILAAAISAALAGCATQTPTSSQLPQGVKFIAAEQAGQSAIGIPFKKYQLANGLTVILHEDKSDPLVHVDVTYHVGSARELPGKSGFAHLFEHMMFQGSQHVADEQHFKVITEAGGTLNGTTNSDRTNYYETVPSNQLQKVLWLEADRMGFFLPALTEKKFEIQRETVKNERAQRIDNQPYGRMDEQFSKAFYPEGHPYSWPVIGWPKDLDRANLNDVRAFFKRWYSPNNATLTIGGNFNEAQALAWVNKYFGDIPRGPEVKPLPKTPVTLDKTRYISMEDRVHLPLIRIGYPTVYARHQDEPALDLLATILGGGKTSLFYKNLVKNGYAVQAGVSHPCSELSCQMFMYALANPAKKETLADLEKRINQSIAEFEKRGVTDADLEKAKIQFKADTIFGLQSVSGKVSTLAHNQTFFGQPDLTAADLKRYSNVTKADVMRVFDKYIKGKPHVVMSVVPEGQKQLIAHGDNYTAKMPAPADIAALPVKDPRDGAKPVVDNFDRSKMPKAGAAPVMTVPQLWTAKLSNGIEVMGTQSNETPTVELLIYLNGGHELEPVAKSGLAVLTAAMMNESTTQHSGEALAQQLEMLGSSVQFGASGNQSYIKVSALTQNLPQTMKIVTEKLFSPAFNAADFQRLKQQQLQGLQHQMAEPDYLARTAFIKLMYGADNARGISSDGTLATVSALTLDDVKAFYKQQYRAGNAQIVAVSNLPESKMLSDLKGLDTWQGAATPIPAMKPLPKLAGGTIYLVNKPGAAQSVIMIGKRALPFDATGNYFKSELMNYPLGGAFNSRINLNLREDKGYTYGASTGFNGGRDTGTFMAYANVRSNVTDKALIEFIKEIKAFRAKGMTDAELEFMRKSISQSKALDYETPYQKAGFIRTIQKYGLDHHFTDKQADIIAHISRAELNKLAASELDIGQMIMLVVGDQAKIEPGLKALGYPVKSID